MDKHEQLLPVVPAEDSRPELPIVCVDERSGRNIVATGRNALSGLMHTSFEPVKADELKNVTIPYDQ